MGWPQSDRGVFAISVAAGWPAPPGAAHLRARGACSAGPRPWWYPSLQRCQRRTPSADSPLTQSGLNLAGVKRVLALESELAEMGATIERFAQLEDQPKKLRDR